MIRIWSPAASVRLIRSAGSGKLPVAQPVEGRLQIVRKTGDVVKTEHRTRSFDGMQGPEGARDYLAVFALLIQLQQRRFQLREQLACFFLK